MANSFEREYGGCHAQLDGGRTPVYERLEYSNLKDWNFQVFSLELNAPSQNLSRGRQNRRRPPNSRVRGRGDLGAARCSPAACGQRPCAPAAQQQQSGPAPFAQATKAPPHRSTPRPAHHAPPPPLLSPVDTGSDGKTATRMKRLGRWPAASSGDWRSRPSLGTASNSGDPAAGRLRSQRQTSSPAEPGRAPGSVAAVQVRCCRRRRPTGRGPEGPTRGAGAGRSEPPPTRREARP